MSELETSANTSPQPAAIDVGWAREQFPSLERRVGAREVAYFDNPAGTQVPRPTSFAREATIERAAWTMARSGGASPGEGCSSGRGHHYALTLMQRWGLGEAGVVRVGAVHYNTAAEVERLLAALDELAQ